MLVRTSLTLSLVAGFLSFIFLVDISANAEVVEKKELILKGSVSGTKQLVHLAISGTLVAGGGDENDSLKVFDISNPDSPSLIYNHILPEQFTAICVDGPYFYFTHRVGSPRQGWLDILDVNDPSSPTLVCHYRTRDAAGGVDKLSGDVVLVGDDDAGLTLINVSNLANPVILDTYGQLNTENVKIYGDIAAVCDLTTGRNRLNLYDISSGVSISRVGSVAIPDKMQEMAFKGNNIYLAQSDAGVLIYDVSNPSTPILKSTISTIGKAYGVDIIGTTLYVASGERLWIYDVTNPSLPELQLSCKTDGYARSVKVSGSTIVVGTDDSLQVFELVDVSPERLVRQGTVADTQQMLHLTATGDIIVAGGYYNDSIKVFDVSDPKLPKLTYSYPLPDLFTAICSEGPYVFCSNRVRSTGKGWMDILDVSDPAAPTLVSHYPAKGLAYGMDVENNVAIIGDYGSGMTVLDVSKPDNPQLIDTYAQSFGANVEMNGDLAAVRSAATNDNRLNMYDISNERSIQRLSSVPLPDMTHDLAFRETSVYLAQNYAGVLIYDVTNPTVPVLKNTITDIGKASGVDVVGPKLYVASGQKLMTYDVTDPAAPQLELSYDTGEDARSVVVKDSLIAVGTEDSLQLFTIEQNPLSISSLKDGPCHIGSILPVFWTSDLNISGTAVKFELWNKSGKVADLKYAWNAQGKDVADLEMPEVPIGKYWIRVSSTWAPNIIAYGDTFELKAYNAVQPDAWLGYE